MSGTERTRRRRRRDGGQCAFAALVALAACRSEPIEQPVPLGAESPVEYPRALYGRNAEGTTILRVLVNDSGRIDSVAVAEGSGHAGLDSAAVQGALAMEFEPALEDGEPVAVWVDLPVRFAKGSDPASSDSSRPDSSRPGSPRPEARQP